ncbi:MAG: hypothetical protein HGA44_11355 [Cellulomonadaceae bacterium]|nr:hypothetical protein [Cellulomonadaceae bacterium]
MLGLAGEHLGRPAVVAVDGRSAGGKSTFSARLAAAVPGAALVHTDDVSWYESFFGWDTLLADGVLTPARRGEPVSFRPPAWDVRGRIGAIEVPAGVPLLVLEGVGAGRRSLTHLVDAVVWVQSDATEARRRGLLRDAAERGGAAHDDGSTVDGFWDEWESMEAPFLADDRPWERAGLIVCGTPPVPYDRDREVVTGRLLG